MPVETTPGGHHRFRLEDVERYATAAGPISSSGPKLIGTRAVARFLGVSQHTVIRACRDGRLEADEVTPGGHRRFSEARVRELAPRAYELVGTRDAARVLGLTVDKLLRAVRKGALIPAAITPGGHRRFAAAELPSIAFPTGRHSNPHANGNGAANAPT